VGRRGGWVWERGLEKESGRVVGRRLVEGPGPLVQYRGGASLGGRFGRVDSDDDG